MRGDPLRLGQVLLNFASNAVKFTESGMIVLRARWLGAVEDRLWVRFEVCDTGIGLTLEQTARLFRAFEQADNTTTRRYGGTGLGLVISRRLIELMGGRLGVDSTLGKGSLFWCEFPCALSQPSSTVQPPRFHGQRILVVDDLHEVRAAFREQLQALGLNVETVASGLQALALLTKADQENHPFALALLDWQMPEPDGLVTAQRIEHLGLRAPPRIVLLSALDRSLPPEAQALRNLSTLLLKPVMPATLLTAVAAALEQPLAPIPDAGAAFDLESVLRNRNHSQPARILLAEDNLINQEVAKALLEDTGLIVDVADDGRSALDRARQTRYDLVLMDVQMPVLDGLQATRAIHELPGQQALPILAMTASAFADERQKCFAAGMCDHLAKPVDPDRLYAALLKWLPAQSLRPAPAPEPLTSEAILTTLNSIEGLDARVGLHRLRHRLHSYIRLLGQFARNHAGDADQIRRHCIAGQRDEARGLAHGLKGTAGNLGLLQVQQQALDLEVAIREQQPEGFILSRVDARQRS